MQHVRIDDGVKRGPKQRLRPIPNRRNEEGVQEGIPPDLNPHDVLQMYLDRPSTSQIAAELGVRRKTLVGWIRQREPEKWKSVQIVRALIRKEDADEGLESAEDALSLARAREMLRSAQFDLERLDSATWGQQQQVVVTFDLGTALQQISERMQSLPKPQTEEKLIESVAGDDPPVA